MCRCVSIMPGMTMPPAASISNVPSGTSRPGPDRLDRARRRRARRRRRRSGARRPSSARCRARKTIGRPGSGVEAFVLTGLLRVGSRDEDRSSGRRRRGAGAPTRRRRRRAGRRRDRRRARPPAACPVRRRYASRLSSSGGWATEKPRTSSDFERISGAGSVISRAAMLPTSTWRAQWAAARIAATAGAPQSMSIVTSTPSARRLAQHVRPARRADLDDCVRARAVQPVARAAGGDDPAGAEDPGRLNRDAPDRARRAEHEHRLPRLQSGTPLQREPRAEPGVAERGRHRVVDAVGHGQQRVAPGRACARPSSRRAARSRRSTRACRRPSAPRRRCPRRSAAAAGRCRTCRSPCAGRGGAGPPRRRPRARSRRVPAGRRTPRPAASSRAREVRLHAPAECRRWAAGAQPRGTASQGERAT